MGCGTGPRLPADPAFVATLKFNQPQDPGSAVYRDFKSALDWVLRGVRVDNLGNYGIQEVTALGSTSIAQVIVTLTGNIPDPSGLNRAVNRLLWGTRHRLTDLTGHRVPGTDSNVTVTADPENWLNEET